MVNLEILEKEYGITQEFLRKTLGGDMALQEVKDDNFDRRIILRNRIRSRIDEGMIRNFANFKLYYALDCAWDAPFQQQTSTLVQSIMDKNQSDEDRVKAFEQWGLTSMIMDERDAKTNQPTGKKALNLETFTKIFLPLVVSYLKMRWAKIVNDRMLTPFFKFEPIKLRMDMRTKCEVISDRIDVMSRMMGYFDTFKKAVFNGLHYGSVFQFPKEEWWFEEQWRRATKEDVANEEVLADGKTKVKVDDLFKKVVKEGVRYHHPHPSRTYRDLAHPATSYNTDTGAEFAGYWEIVRYRDIANNPAFYNAGVIGLSDKNITDINRLFFQTVYGAMTLTYPSLVQGNNGTSDLDREKKLSNLYYGTDHMDQGILKTEHWEKINPKRDGLVNTSSPMGKEGYDCDVWMRFMVAGTNGTILYAAPVPSCPVTYAGYDADESRAQNSSMTLEILPTQDHCGNILSQMLLSMKQNLANMTLIDTDQVVPEWLDKVKNIGSKFYTSLNIFGFSGTKAKKAMHQVPAAVQNFGFTKANLQEQALLLKEFIEMLERVLGMSSQEVAQAASHEQSREEIVNIKQNSSSRLRFTATPFDIMRDAWKIQLYNYDMTYGKASFFADISIDADVSRDQLTAWGFVVEEHDQKHANDRTIRVKATRELTAIPVWMFASTRDGDDRYNDPQIAQAMMMMVQALMGNPMTAAAIGPEQAIMLANVIGQYAGLPRDFRLRSLIKPGDAPPNQQQAQQILQEVMQEVAKTIKPIADQVQKLGEGMQQLAPAAQAAQAVPAIGQEMQKIEQVIQPMVEHVEALTKAVGLVLHALNINPPTSNDQTQQPPANPAGQG